MCDAICDVRAVRMAPRKPSRYETQGGAGAPQLERCVVTWTPCHRIRHDMVGAAVELRPIRPEETHQCTEPSARFLWHAWHWPPRCRPRIRQAKKSSRTAAAPVTAPTATVENMRPLSRGLRRICRI